MALLPLADMRKAVAMPGGRRVLININMNKGKNGAVRPQCA